MGIYARVWEGQIVELFETDDDMADLFNPGLIWVDITNINPQPDYGWSATAADGNWSFAAPSND